MNEIEEWNARVDAKKQAKLLRKVEGGMEFVQPEAKTGSNQPFKRAKKMYMEVLEMKAKYQNNLGLLQMLIDGMAPYASRGHGGRHRTKNRTILGAWNHVRSKYVPHQGERECWRRARPASQYWAPAKS